jgi:HAD superfamily hydrolase (TIGR01484 family)
MIGNAPRAWTDVPLPQLARLRGVLTDIDDTLTRDGAIEPAAVDALRQLHAAGMPVIAITGRPAGWSEPFARSWPVNAIVAENGGVMLRRLGGQLQREFAQDDTTRAIHFERLQACARDVLAQVPGTSLARDSAGRLTDIAIDHSEFTQLDAPSIDRVVALMRAHGLHATVSSIHINGWLGDHNKFTAAQWAVPTCLDVPFDVHEWLYVGDSTNDQLMFERLPLTVGVANLMRFADQVTTWPTYLTARERGHGFADIAMRLLQACGSAPAA